MRFRHLTLQGYKSFATKSEFLFSPGITAIVGPNGSGKSNIADGIRWVLGEQSMRSLRGKSSADMIFAGGRRRARAGMAEVSMILDNSEAWLPIEFGEVTITRRAYRSGENEYLLNGSRVRLRDVSELLSQSGIGQRTHTVIGQGLVDAALALQPAERRALFEEAAGISLYRSKRENALRRLEETGHNLERVYDIVEEITPRLRRLEREVERVEEHLQVSRHLEGLQRTWYGFHWGEQQAALGHALESAALLETSLEARQAEAASLDAQLARQRQRESDLRACLRDWHRESADLLDRVNELQRELAVGEERARLLETRRQELAAEVEPMAAQLEAQKQRVAEAEAQAGQLGQELAQHRGHLASLEREWEALRVRAQEPDRQRAGLEQQVRACRAELERLNHELAEARAEEARLAGEEETLKRLHETWASYDAGVRALLQSDLPGVVSPLAALVQAPPEWEQAVETALGADLQAIVVESSSAVESARLVLDQSGGRATLLPLDDLRPPPPLPTAATRAADVVSCTDDVRPAVEAVLGSVALCDDLAAARGMLPALPPGSRCATATGAVLRADGALSLGRAVEGGVLSSERALREMPQRLESIRGRCRQIEQARQAEMERAAALEAELAEAGQRVAQAREEVARFEREVLASARTRIAVAEETLRSHQAGQRREKALLERVHAQMTARRQRTDELTVEHAAVVARALALQSDCSRLEDALNQVRGRIRPAEEEMARLEQEQAGMERDAQHARERVHNAEAYLGRARLEVDRCRGELKMLRRQIEEDLGIVELDLAEGVTAQTPLPLRPLVSELPVVEQLPEGLEEDVQRVKARLRRLGDVNPNAPADYQEVRERHQFLVDQSTDLEQAGEKLRAVIEELDELMKTAFQETFDAVAARFSEVFTTLFNGGTARLELTEPDDLMNTGVDIVARPPGKRAQRLALLSGGERSLTAVALLFSLLHVSPAPFCVLDEVDAMLDEANVGRFRALLEDLGKQTQFIIITHNRGTVEAADTIYGISMGTDGVSQVVSLKLDQETEA